MRLQNNIAWLLFNEPLWKPFLIQLWKPVLIHLWEPFMIHLWKPCKTRHDPILEKPVEPLKTAGAWMTKKWHGFYTNWRKAPEREPYGFIRPERKTSCRWRNFLDRAMIHNQHDNQVASNHQRVGYVAFKNSYGLYRKQETIKGNPGKYTRNATFWFVMNNMTRRFIY